MLITLEHFKSLLIINIKVVINAVSYQIGTLKLNDIITTLLQWLLTK